jgi:hypothetical protein
LNEGHSADRLKVHYELSNPMIHHSILRESSDTHIFMIYLRLLFVTPYLSRRYWSWRNRYMTSFRLNANRMKRILRWNILLMRRIAYGRTQRMDKSATRYPEVTVLTEMVIPLIWFPINEEDVNPRVRVFKNIYLFTCIRPVGVLYTTRRARDCGQKPLWSTIPYFGEWDR